MYVVPERAPEVAEVVGSQAPEMAPGTSDAEQVEALKAELARVEAAKEAELRKHKREFALEVAQWRHEVESALVQVRATSSSALQRELDETKQELANARSLLAAERQRARVPGQRTRSPTPSPQSRGSATDEVEQLRVQLADLQTRQADEISGLKNYLTTLEQKASDAQSEITGAKQLNETLHQRCEASQAENMRLSAQNTRLSANVDELRQALSQRLPEQSVSDDPATSLQHHLQQLGRNLERSNDKTLKEKTEIGAVIGGYQADLYLSQSREKQRSEELQAARSLETELKMQVEQLQQAHQATEKEHNQALQQHKQAFLALRRNVEQSTHARTEQQQEMERIGAKYREELEAAEGVEQHLTMQLKQLQETRVATEQEHSQALQHHEEANQALRIDVEQSAHARAEQQEETMHLRAKLQEELEAAQGVEQELKQALEQLQETRETTEQEHTQALQQLEDANQALRTEVEQYGRARAEQQKEMNKVEQQLQHETQCRATHEKILAEKQAQTLILSTEIAELRAAEESSQSLEPALAPEPEPEPEPKPLTYPNTKDPVSPDSFKDELEGDRVAKAELDELRARNEELRKELAASKSPRRQALPKLHSGADSIKSMRLAAERKKARQAKERTGRSSGVSSPTALHADMKRLLAEKEAAEEELRQTKQILAEKQPVEDELREARHHLTAKQQALERAHVSYSAMLKYGVQNRYALQLVEPVEGVPPPSSSSEFFHDAYIENHFACADRHQVGQVLRHELETDRLLSRASEGSFSASNAAELEPFPGNIGASDSDYVALEEFKSHMQSMPVSMFPSELQENYRRWERRQERSRQGAGAALRAKKAEATKSPAGEDAALAAQRQHLQDCFRRADRNDDGSLSRAELIKQLRADTQLSEILQLPQHVGDGDRDAFENIFQGMARDDNRHITEQEFVDYIIKHIDPEPFADSGRPVTESTELEPQSIDGTALAELEPEPEPEPEPR